MHPCPQGIFRIGYETEKVLYYMCHTDNNSGYIRNVNDARKRSEKGGQGGIPP